MDPIPQPDNTTSLQPLQALIQSTIKHELLQLRADIKSDIASFHTQTKSDIDLIRTDISGIRKEIKEIRHRLGKNQQQPPASPSSSAAASSSSQPQPSSPLSVHHQSSSTPYTPPLGSPSMPKHVRFSSPSRCSPFDGMDKRRGSTIFWGTSSLRWKNFVLSGMSTGLYRETGYFLQCLSLSAYRGSTKEVVRIWMTLLATVYSYIIDLVANKHPLALCTTMILCKYAMSHHTTGQSCDSVWILKRLAGTDSHITKHLFALEFTTKKVKFENEHAFKDLTSVVVLLIPFKTILYISTTT